ncbi:MAG TPA: hypothetical protein PKO22_12455, partial [Treponemataceae bacterium]|nr:hypothetical protein [Treponemataceae bacterium]
LVALLSASVHAQSVMNPSDSVYEDIRDWQTKGLVGLLPQLRPYPAQLVKDVLAKVSESGSAVDANRARYQSERLFGKPIVIGVKAEGTMLAGTGESAKQLVGGIFAAGHIEPIDLTSIEFDFNILASNKSFSTLIAPAHEKTSYDLVDDPMTISSSIPIFGYFLGNASAAFGTSEAYIQAGLNRSSWGDFIDDGIVVSPDAFHMGNFTAALNRDTWNYGLSMFCLSATTNGNGGFYPEKFLVLHSITAAPAPILEITFFENIVYGKRIEPLYLVPVVPMMISQGMAGFNEDNLMMGLSLKVKPIKGLAWSTAVMMDDMNLNEFIKLDFNTQIKLAGQTGIVWTPESALVSSVSLDYTLVMPYMYTHSSNDTDNTINHLTVVNYQNYTNRGYGIGSQLNPNSDSIALKTTVRPFDSLQLKLAASFIRHANVNESLPDDVAQRYLDAANGDYHSDGGINNYPELDEQYIKFARENLLFLSQETMEYTIRGSIDASWELPREVWGQISLTAAWTCEYIINYGVDRDMYPSSVTTPAAAKQAWKDNLKNVMNNYVSLGLKYSW